MGTWPVNCTKIHTKRVREKGETRDYMPLCFDIASLTTFLLGIMYTFTLECAFNSSR